MSDSSIPAPLLSFIRAHVTSVWALELLLFLRKHGDTAWSVEQLVRELRGSGPLIADLVLSLEQARLAERVGDAYRFRPATDELASRADELDRLSNERPLTVRNAILAAPHHKVQVFADAFRIKRD